MIYLSLGKPDGAGGFTRVAAFSTDDEDRDWAFWPECSILKDYLDSIGSISNRIDCSRARGGIAQGTTFEFSLIDWDETELARRSVGLISGAERFQGWAVDLVRTAGPQAQAPTGTDLDYYGGHEWYFQVDDASVSGDALRLSCVARWSLDGTTVGAGAGDAVVGLVAGGHDVSVETQGLPSPEVIEYQTSTTWKAGNPSAPIDAALRKANATGKYIQATAPNLGPCFSFQCATLEDASDLYSKLQAGFFPNPGVCISGREYSEKIGTLPISGFAAIDRSGDRIDVAVSQAFYDAEEFENVSLFSFEQSNGIAAGASGLRGFIDNGRVIDPIGDRRIISDFILSFAPQNIAAGGGFLSYTITECSIAWDGVSAYAPGQAQFYLGTEQIKTDGSSPSSYSVIDSSLVPAPPLNFAIRFLPDGGIDQISLPLRVIISPDDATRFDRFVSDVDARIELYSGTAGSFSAYAPFTAEFIEPIAPLGYLTINITPNGQGEKDFARVYASVDALNTAPGVVMYRPGSGGGSGNIVYMEIRAITIYGVSELSFGSNSAVVTPGASLFWASPQAPQSAATSLLPQLTEFAPLSSPSYLPGAPAWGEYLAPELTGIQAAESIAKEFFFDLYPNLISQPLKIPLIGTDFAPPAPSLGRVEDIVTEPTIKYGWFDGAYTKTAYVAHVDEPYDSTQPDRYFGGWGKSLFGDDFGYEIWKRCRDAWKAHGIKRAETFEAPGVHDAATMGRMYWAAEFYGAKRIDWLAFQPRFLEYTGKAGFFSGEISSGMPVEIPKALSDFSEYDLDGITTGRLVEWELDPITERARMLVMIAPVVEAGGSIEIWSDTINPATDRILDTVDSALERITDTIEG